jgi:hypothetical protein
VSGDEVDKHSYDPVQTGEVFRLCVLGWRLIISLLSGEFGFWVPPNPNLDNCFIMKNVT